MIFFYFLSPTVCRAWCWQLHLLQSYGTAACSKTALTKPCIPWWTAFTHASKHRGPLPCHRVSCQRGGLPHTIQPQEIPSPHTVSHSSVLCLQKQLQGAQPHTWATLTTLSLQHSPECCTMLRRRKSWPCLQMAYLQVGLGGPRGGLGSSLNHMGNIHRDKMFKLKTALNSFLKPVQAYSFFFRWQ